jgi:hypothetical protein
VLPEVGEILFHSGSPHLVPTMTWRYWEPRSVTKLRVLPVPFNVASKEEEDAPAISSTVKVSQWDGLLHGEFS